MDSVLYQDRLQKALIKVAEQLSLDENLREMKTWMARPVRVKAYSCRYYFPVADALAFMILKEKMEIDAWWDWYDSDAAWIYISDKRQWIAKNHITLVYKGQDTIHTAMCPKP